MKIIAPSDSEMQFSNRNYLTKEDRSYYEKWTIED